MKALVAGTAESAMALAAALREQGIEAESYGAAPTVEKRSVAPLARALVEFEQRLGSGYDVAVASGSGDAAIALAIVAAKRGLPLAASIETVRPASGELDPAERRILTELAELVVKTDSAPDPALTTAQRIASWARARAATGDAVGAPEA